MIKLLRLSMAVVDCKTQFHNYYMNDPAIPFLDIVSK
jgi:hypothetical protein